MAGTTGYNYKTMSIDENIVAQATQTLQNIDDTLNEAGFDRTDIVKVLYIVPNAAEFEQCWPVLKAYFGAIRPTATMISADLFDLKMKIEIEITALKKGETIS